MRPTRPGTYVAREITYDLLGGRLLSHPEKVHVVEGVKNERNHRLLVETGLRQPKFKSLDCFEWPQTAAL